MIKVASYCRVSTDHDDQANSFEAQQRYFREYIRHHPDWELYDIYADEGITGTSTKKRSQFNRMINDAYDGKFQLIVTKEVSRFSRNILDTISYTRELKAIGVEVQFVIDGIHTFNQDAELHLSIMASMAQEESRKTSSRVTWGQTRQMEKGIVFGHSLLGYDVKNGNISINPEGAHIVQLIFQKYALEHFSTRQIARYLSDKGYATSCGNKNWTGSTVTKILKNEKYMGDLVQKKTYTPDFLTHEKRKNSGEVPLIRIENHHEPIVSRKLWSLVQTQLLTQNKHSDKSSGHSNRYVFSGKIKCGQCGASFVGRIKYQKNGQKERRWSCGTAVKHGKKACHIGRLVRDDDAMQMLKTAVRSLNLDRNAVVSNIISLVKEASQAGEESCHGSPARLHSTILHIQQKKEILLDSFLSGCISKTDMQLMNLRYDTQLEELRIKAEKTAMAPPDSVPDEAVLRSMITALLSGENDSEAFSKAMLHSLTVYGDRNSELRLNCLPMVFRFTG